MSLQTTPAMMDVEAPVEAPVRTSTMAPALRDALLDAVEERGQVTVRCRFMADEMDMVRIWPSTYLVCRSTGHRSQLLHAEGISHAPEWMPVPAGKELQFTLVFAPLPPGCSVFDLIEEIPTPGGFTVHGIRRNDRDLYHVAI